jgi:putative aldouronate transport system substrate-binding protein
MKKILASVALFALLAFALTFATACGSDDPAPAPQPGQAATQPGQQPVTPPPAVPGQPTETPAADLPEIELTIHYHVGHSFFRDDWPAWQQIMAATNVRLVGTANPVATDGGEQFNLEAASLFPAHIYGGQHLATLFMEFGMQGAFVPLNDLIANYAPHFNAILEANPMIRAAITAPDGNIYHLPTLPDGLQEGARAWFIRQDWLDLLGRDIPQTVEELEETLIAFRDEIPPLIGVD